ncbi:PRC-barrel domain containing protein [Massilia forsythiae]|uniref:PRC-barrel domain containing protein n=1 Tax=Massilia forsythiae TaxID=2728020 RepID=A0A7Z2ZUM9_9BURK|nr:PRC-barrel domain-containing protein [Massilia forsythiae]QJE02470.1 PRC-barrel domain containing protein [Massilia forsythiae]
MDNKAFLTGTDQAYGFKPPAGTARSMRASRIIGRDVNSRAGKDIGKIKDLVVDVDTGNVKYAVLSFDPSWFTAGKLFAFPLTSFKVENDKDELMLDVDKNMLASMKNFDADKWGSLNDLNRDNLVNTLPQSAVAK